MTQHIASTPGTSTSPSTPVPHQWKRSRSRTVTETSTTTTITTSTSNGCGVLGPVGNSVVAGYVAGIAGTIVGHPMDSAKVWLQTNHNFRNTSAATTTLTAATMVPPSDKANGIATKTHPSALPPLKQCASPGPNVVSSSSSSLSTSRPVAMTSTGTLLPPARAPTTAGTTPSTITPTPTALTVGTTATTTTTTPTPTTTTSRMGSVVSNPTMTHSVKNMSTWASPPAPPSGTTLLVAPQMQQQHNSPNLNLRMTHVVRQSVQTLRALYSGISGPLVTVGFVQAINFAIYDSVRRVLHARDQEEQHFSMYTKSQQQQQPTRNLQSGIRNDDSTVLQSQQQYKDDATQSYLNNDSLYNVAMSSMIAGAVLSYFTSPMLLVKTKQQLQAGLSFRTALRQVLYSTTTSTSARPTATTAFRNFAMPQWRNMYVGFAPHFLSETVGRGVYFVVYEVLKRHYSDLRTAGNSGMHQQHHQQQQRDVPLEGRMMSAVIAGMVCWSVIFPLDALRCRLYAQAARAQQQQVPDRSTYTGSREMMKRMYQEGGWKAFYRGFGVTILRAGPVAAVVLPIYDLTLEQLSFL